MKAIYAFSGDPITYGHIDTIRRAAKSFDEVIAAIGENPDKKYTFNIDERREMAMKSLSHLSNVAVDSFHGIRNNEDFNYEVLLDQIGESQKLGIETFFIPSRQDKLHISSSAVKAIQKEQGLIHEYVPLYVKQCLEAKISNQHIIGITGEMGSGKSYVSKKLIELGKTEGIEIHNIELDHIGHKILGELQEPIYKKAREQIIEIFGHSINSPNGFIDRKILGSIIFNDQEKLKQLNEIMYTPLMVRLRKEMYGKKGLILFNAALIAESDMSYLCNNNVILVKADKESQERRLKKRGHNNDQIKRRLKSQYSAQEKEERIEYKISKDNQGKIWTIDNSDNADQNKVSELLEDIMKYMEIK